MTRKPLSSIENTMKDSVTRSSTRSISRNVSNFSKNISKLCEDINIVLSATQKIRFQMDQKRLAQYIQNRRTGSLIYKAQQMESFWLIPEDNLHRYRDWLNLLRYWKMVCISLRVDENTTPRDMRLLHNKIKEVMRLLKKMLNKCKQWSQKKSISQS